MTVQCVWQLLRELQPVVVRMTGRCRRGLVSALPLRAWRRALLCCLAIVCPCLIPATSTASYHITPLRLRHGTSSISSASGFAHGAESFRPYRERSCSSVVRHSKRLTLRSMRLCGFQGEHQEQAPAALWAKLSRLTVVHFTGDGAPAVA